VRDALVGVFLGPEPPDPTPAPPPIDCSTQSARDYITLEPALKQVCFIGDGRADTIAALTRPALSRGGRARSKFLSIRSHLARLVLAVEHAACREGNAICLLPMLAKAD